MGATQGHLDTELDYRRDVSGRCRSCNIRFIWGKGMPRLKDAACPYCGSPLYLTTHLFKGKTERRTVVTRGTIKVR